MRRLLDYDPMTGITSYHSYDDVTKTTTIEEVQDPTPFLELNKAQYKDPDFRKNGIKNEWLHAARIPVIIQHKWLLEEGIDCYAKDHWPAVKRKLNDPDWRYLRVTQGRV